MILAQAVARSRQVWNVDLIGRTFIVYDAICMVAAMIFVGVPAI